MHKRYIYLIFVFLLPFLKIHAKEKVSFSKNSKISSNFEKLKTRKISQLNWENVKKFTESQLDWEKLKDWEENSSIKEVIRPTILRRETKIKALDRAVVVNDIPYPEISHYVPNGYVSYDERFVTTNLRAISKLRFCDGKNFEYKCADGILNVDFNLVSNEDFSFNPRFSMQSLSNRGTKFGEQSTIGFRLAKSINPNWSIAFGGENLIHLDKDIDLGRNLYLVTSTYKKLGSSKKRNPSLLFLNIGLGSDFYGYKGNGFLFRTPCLGKPNLTGDKSNNCSWGPIGSISLAANDRITFVNEWFGYSYGSGISVKPFKQRNIIFSLFATDFIKDFPKYAKDHCPNNECETRFYGNISLSF